VLIADITSLLAISSANSLLFIMASHSPSLFSLLTANGSALSPPSPSNVDLHSAALTVTSPNLPAVIIHLSSGKKVSALSVEQLTSFSNSLCAQVGHVVSSRFLSGGDLSVRPADESQKVKLLALSVIDNLNVSCSLPKSVTTQKGIIRGVPLIYSDEDILANLENQNVTKVERLRLYKSSSPDERAPSGSVTLVFNGSIPTEIRIGLVNFRVEKFYPFTHRCKNCLRTGHLADPEGNCKNGPRHSPALCFNCAKPHDDLAACDTYCVNCKSTEHNSRSNNCPSFQEMNAVIRLSIDDNISISDARVKLGLNSSPLVKKGLSYAARLSNPSSFPAAPASHPMSSHSSNSSPSALQRQVNDLQKVVESLQQKTIPELDKKIDDVKSDLLETCKTIEQDFEKVNSRLLTQDKLAIQMDILFKHFNLQMPPDSALPARDAISLNDDEDDEENEDMTIDEVPLNGFANSDTHGSRTSTTPTTHLKRKSTIKSSFHSIQKAKNKSQPICSSALTSSKTAK